MSIFWKLVSFNMKSNLEMNIKTKKSRIGTICLYTFLILFLLADFAYMAYNMANTGVNLITMGLFYATMFIIVNTIYSANKYILGSKDYDFLISMPIKKNTIVLSKFVGLLMLCYIFELLACLPFFVMYFIFNGITIQAILFSVIILAIFPLIELAISFALWLIVGLLLKNLPFKNILMIILFIAIFGLIMYASSTFASTIQNGTLEFLNTSFASIIFYPVILATKAIVISDWISLLILIAICIIPFILVLCLTAKYYNKLNYLFDTHSKAKKIDLVRDSKSHTIFETLYNKEMKHLFNNPMYLLNTCVGPIMLIILSIIMGITMTSIPEISFIKDIYCLLSGFFILLSLGIATPMTASISLEGKNWWLIKSLPITYNQIIWSKMLMYITIFAPCAIISVIINSIFFSFTWLHILLLLALSIVILLFYGLFGLLLNLKHYNFDWTNENIVTKQGTPVVINVLASFAVSIAIFLLYMYVLINYISPLLYCGIIIALFTIATIILLIYIQKKGKQIFEEIECR